MGAAQLARFNGQGHAHEHGEHEEAHGPDGSPNTRPMWASTRGSRRGADLRARHDEVDLSCHCSDHGELRNSGLVDGYSVSFRIKPRSRIMNAGPAVKAEARKRDRAFTVRDGIFFEMRSASARRRACLSVWRRHCCSRSCGIRRPVRSAMAGPCSTPS
jgi:hypothetical protein